MKDSNKTEDRDEVLFAFHQECPRPTSEQIIAWTSRFPQLAEDIRAHAAVAWDWATHEAPLVEHLDEILFARGYSQALNIIFNAENSVTQAQTAASCETFQQMLTAAGKDVPSLARELDIGRSVLADVFNGWMLAPVRSRLVDSIVSALKNRREAFNWALERALHTQYLGHAKADK
jgi:hypothetical protein